MAIVIKEIHVKTTIESRSLSGSIKEQQLQAIKRQLLQEVKQLIQKEIKQKGDR